MTDAFNVANRYPDDSADVLVEALAKLNGVQRGGRSSSGMVRVRSSSYVRMFSPVP